LDQVWQEEKVADLEAHRVRRSSRAWLAAVGTVIAAVVALAAWQGAGPAAGQQGPLFRLAPANQTVALSSGTVQVEVRIENVTDLAAFDFVLRYDPGVLESPAVVGGGFLGSTGRHVDCLLPLVDLPENGEGTVQFGCATLALGVGVSGSGLLATVTFDLAGGAYTPLLLTKVEATNAHGDTRCPGGPASCPVQNGSVTVSGGSSNLQQGVSPTPTPAALPPDPTPVGGTVTGAPGSPGAGSPGDASSGGSPAGTPGGSGGPAGTTPGATGTIGVAGPGAGAQGGAPGLGELGDANATASGSRVVVATMVVLVLAGAGLAASAVGLRRLGMSSD
jgi:hypothetical protein